MIAKNKNSGVVRHGCRVISRQADVADVARPTKLVDLVKTLVLCGPGCLRVKLQALPSSHCDGLRMVLEQYFRHAWFFRQPCEIFEDVHATSSTISKVAVVVVVTFRGEIPDDCLCFFFFGMCRFPKENQQPIFGRGGHRFSEEQRPFLFDMK